jgi:uncharacterized protein (DUF2147 family)
MASRRIIFCANPRGRPAFHPWLLTFVLFVVMLASGASWAQSSPTPTPVGVWRTFDDRTGFERGLVVITETAGVLAGRVIGILDPREAERFCTQCEGVRRNKPILGLTIITGMRRDGDRWDSGEILDPQTGEVYRCVMRLEGGGTKLVVRGYIGFSLFGRSQTWIRQTY